MDESNSRVHPAIYSPLSPSSMNYLKGTLNSPVSFNFTQVLTPCHLDSPRTPNDNSQESKRLSLGWGLAVESLSPINGQTSEESGSWTQDLHTLLSLPSWSNNVSPLPLQNQQTIAAPPLSGYHSDGESPDSTPFSSDVEDSPKGLDVKEKKRAKRSISEITTQLEMKSCLKQTCNKDDFVNNEPFTFDQKLFSTPISSSSLHGMPSLSFLTEEPKLIKHEPQLWDNEEVLGLKASNQTRKKTRASDDSKKKRKQKETDSCIPPDIKYDETEDEIVKAALLEDTFEAKSAAFPKLWEQAKSYSVTSDDSGNPESVAINALLSAFTNDDKAGRKLPQACQELLQRATIEVAEARQRQRENKTVRRTSIIHNQVGTAVFACNAKGCTKKYTTAEGLRLHIRNHHDVDKKWICHSEHCTAERAFVRQADLRMHLIRMHSPVRPFPCRVPECTKTFACHSELRRHISTEHPTLVKQLMAEIRKGR